MNALRTYICDTCRQPIERWQSWHDTGYSLTHMACELGRTPAEKDTRKITDKMWFNTEEKLEQARVRALALSR